MWEIWCRQFNVFFKAGNQVAEVIYLRVVCVEIGAVPESVVPGVLLVVWVVQPFVDVWIGHDRPDKKK